MVIQALTAVGSPRTHWIVVYSKDKKEKTGYIPLSSDMKSVEIADKILMLLKDMHE